MLTEFDAVIKIKYEDDITQNKNKNVLLVSTFYSPTPGLYEYGFQDQVFAQEIKRLLTPIIEVPQIPKSDAAITVALHVRKGGGFDAPLASSFDTLRMNGTQSQKKKPQYADQQWPTKFPPDYYYIEQVQQLRKLVGNEKHIIAYLFTDDPDPAALAARYQEKMVKDMEFKYRISGNAHDAHVLEDFYMMAQCECLIRSSSLFAKAAQLIGTHRYIFYPITGYWVDDTLIINPVGIIVR